MWIENTFMRSAESNSVVIDAQPEGGEDQVDQDIAVPGLQQPVLGRVLTAHAEPQQHVERPLERHQA